jgi:hypothetical protein
MAEVVRMTAVGGLHVFLLFGLWACLLMCGRVGVRVRMLEGCFTCVFVALFVCLCAFLQVCSGVCVFDCWFASCFVRASGAVFV